MTPVSTMPEAETSLLLEAYREARVILEFGSGASTALAAQMPGKYILSVESDRAWARQLRAQIAADGPKSPVSVYHVDIGPTGLWGRPIDDSGWQRYPNYPNAIWDQPFFRHPDVILIDGRFRPACLMTAMLHITRPVRVLFDDYVNRPRYHLVERLAKPAQLVGRMAEFRLTPGMVKPTDLGFAIAKFFEVTMAGKPGQHYNLPPSAGAKPAASSSPGARSKGKTDSAPDKETLGEGASQRASQATGQPTSQAGSKAAGKTHDPQTSDAPKNHDPASRGAAGPAAALAASNPGAFEAHDGAST